MDSDISRIVNALPGLVRTASPSDEIDFLNQHWPDYTGLSRNESTGRGWQAAVHPEDLDETVERWEAITHGVQPRKMLVRLRRSDGEYRLFLMRVSPLTDPAGQIVKWCGIGTNIEATGPAKPLRYPG